MSKPRILHFVRHGAYEITPESAKHGGILTAVGKRQARRTARFFRGLPIKVVHTSDLWRATQTAEIISEALPKVPIRSTRLLREMIPTGLPGRRVRVPLKRRKESRDDLQKIIRRYFKPARSVRHELVVCHGNLIRALTCTALNVRLTAWYQMGTYNCSITRFAVHGNGKIWLESFNETGHLTSSLITG